MKLKIQELKPEDGTLDWAASVALGLTVFMRIDFLHKRRDFLRQTGRYSGDDKSFRWNIETQKNDAIVGNVETGETKFLPPFSSNWALAGPVRDQERIEIRHRPSPWDDVEATTCSGAPINEFGETAMVAIMRVLVASKLGPEVEVPDELVPHLVAQRSAEQEATIQNKSIDRPRG